MGSQDFMLEQIMEKMNAGFTCIKLKIGAIDFEKELELLRFIRAHFTASQMEIRVDANGAFAYMEALSKLSQLAEFELHSIEQPIKNGQPDKMAKLCLETPLPIALDEELIGCVNIEDKANLLDRIAPQFIILKPSFVGGFAGTQEWIDLAQERGIGWWITSALESNVGLNAIAQWTHTLNPDMPQGLGTGALYTNNIDAPLVVENGALWYDPKKGWGPMP